MNPDLERLLPYPFEKLRNLKNTVTPPVGLEPVNLSIGEPKHPAPEFVIQKLVDELSALSSYPSTQGIRALRESIADWLQRRFKLKKAPHPDDHILPVNGTREALFAFAQTVINRGHEPVEQSPLVLLPNPFYQIYEGAALLAGAEPVYINCTADSQFKPDFESVADTVWRRCQLLYLCTPGNPTGAVLDIDTLKKLIALADRHDFIIASDECYSEIYLDENAPPPGLLQACDELGRDDYRRCVVFHSLSKRSNLPGLRSGFVAGDGDILRQFLLYRTYQGCAMPVQHQLASIAAWDDEVHVQLNRRLYQEKFRIVMAVLQPVMNVQMPDAGFYLWPETPLADTTFTRDLYGQHHVTVLPGSYLARETEEGNPGNNRIRIALVAPAQQCQEAAERIKIFIESL
ncbi:MAG: succinyldiaminopimelate transaminase [Gammaproteobacteria bacterium]|nr:MAG: succinyldiaminopimelate transaminase [Gammaproteobacteria bacterium]RLA54661.1 MAG: succinyldiaminopimelate transaminase [Gammaproteobacteria bacterium]